MKKITALFCLILTIASLKAQTGPKPIVPYRILTTDSVYATPAKLKKTAPVMLIYFSPDCTHCQHFTEELTDIFKQETKDHKKLLLKTQIVMVTFASLQAIQVFNRDYGLNHYPNVIIGTEGYTYTTLNYYQVKSTPYIAIYNKKGILVKAYDKVPGMTNLLASVKKAM